MAVRSRLAYATEIKASDQSRLAGSTRTFRAYCNERWSR